MTIVEVYLMYFYICLTIRVFRFTSKLEFRFEAWGAHADRYDRAIDPPKKL